MLKLKKQKTLIERQNFKKIGNPLEKLLSFQDLIGYETIVGKFSN
jgi:hypothetical protein